jgi:hypothetical protein
MLYTSFWVVPRRLDIVGYSTGPGGAQAIFRANLFTYHTPLPQPQSHFTPTRLWRWNRQSVPKRWHLNCRRRRTTHRKHTTFNIQTTYDTHLLPFSRVAWTAFNNINTPCLYLNLTVIRHLSVSQFINWHSTAKGSAYINHKFKWFYLAD